MKILTHTRETILSEETVATGKLKVQPDIAQKMEVTTCMQCMYLAIFFVHPCTLTLSRSSIPVEVQPIIISNHPLVEQWQIYHAGLQISPIV
jgi:hypothetical protein